MVFPLFISRSECDTSFEDYECVNIQCKYVYIHVCVHSECLYVQCDLVKQKVKQIQTISNRV